jgi:hypothetical protein
MRNRGGRPGGRAPEFNQPRVHPALQEELGVLVDAVLVHAATGMAVVLVAEIELVMLWQVAQLEHPGDELTVLPPAAPLAAVGLEARHRHPQWHAGLAAVAVRSVGKHPAAAKAVGHQVGVGVVVDEVARRGHLRACLPPGQVAAGIGRRGVELQRLERELFEQGHAVGGTMAG